MRNFLPRCFGFADSKQEQPSSMIQELCHRFSLAQLRKATNNYDEIRIIGSARFGTVYKGCILVNGEAKEVGIKRASANFKQQEHAHHVFKNEVVVLCQLRHHNLISLIGFHEDKNEMILVYEYLSKGSLSDRIHRADMPCLSWKKRLEICIGVARGLHYLHTGVKRTIIHCHVKPSKILLDENWVPKIVDFGFSLKGPDFSSKDAKPKEVDRIKGTLAYMAPEYALRGIVTEKIDVYSFGMVLLEVACAKRPHMIPEERRTDVGLNDYDSQDEGISESSISFRNLTNILSYFVHEKNVYEIIDPFLKGKIAPKCLELFMGIIQRCLQEEATERPSMGEVEMELELALQLQEEADTNPPSDSGNSIISSTASSSCQPLEAHS